MFTVAIYPVLVQLRCKHYCLTIWYSVSAELNIAYRPELFLWISFWKAPCLGPLLLYLTACACIWSSLSAHFCSGSHSHLWTALSYSPISHLLACVPWLCWHLCEIWVPVPGSHVVAPFLTHKLLFCEPPLSPQKLSVIQAELAVPFSSCRTVRDVLPLQAGQSAAPLFPLVDSTPGMMTSHHTQTLSCVRVLYVQSILLHPHRVKAIKYITISNHLGISEVNQMFFHTIQLFKVSFYGGSFLPPLLCSILKAVPHVFALSKSKTSSLICQ